MQIKARRCFVPLSPSDWVAKVFLTCDNMIAVQFKHGEKVKKVLPHGPGAYLGHGGVPHVCCLYPGTQGELAETLYELAQVWSYAGEWVHTFLYKKFGYQLVSPPAECGNCNTSCSIQLNPAAPNNGDAVTITVTVTNTDGGSKGEAPEGTVTISVDGTAICTQALPEDEPDPKNWQSIRCNWTATCNPQANHTITATYTPAGTDWASTNGSTTVTVGNCGVQTSCCPGVGVATTLHATVSSTQCPGLAGTYTLTWNPNLFIQGGWTDGDPVYALSLQCVSGVWSLSWLNCGNAPVNPNSAQCSPFQLVFTDLLVESGCCPPGGGSDVNVTITE
jgi:hypothetical protein